MVTIVQSLRRTRARGFRHMKWTAGCVKIAGPGRLSIGPGRRTFCAADRQTQTGAAVLGSLRPACA